MGAFIGSVLFAIIAAFAGGLGGSLGSLLMGLVGGPGALLAGQISSGEEGYSGARRVIGWILCFIGQMLVSVAFTYFVSRYTYGFVSSNAGKCWPWFCWVVGLVVADSPAFISMQGSFSVRREHGQDADRNVHHSTIMLVQALSPIVFIALSIWHPWAR